MKRTGSTVKEYLDALPEDWRKALQAVRKVIRKNLDKKFKEGIQYGGIAYFVPHSVYPPGYHCDPKQPLPFAGIGAQKHHMAISLMCIYNNKAEEKLFRKEWKASGKKLNMGKSCIRFRKLEDVALDVVGRAVKRVTVKKFIASYERSMPKSAKKKAGR